MFSRISTIAFYILFAFTLLATASPAVDKRDNPPPSTTVTVTMPLPTPTSPGQCSIGPIMCCEEVVDQNSLLGSIILGLLGIVVTGVDGFIGLDCTDINLLGGICSGYIVCCEDNNVGGLISVGCIWT